MAVRAFPWRCRRRFAVLLFAVVQTAAAAAEPIIATLSQRPDAERVIEIRGAPRDLLAALARLDSGERGELIRVHSLGEDGEPAPTAMLGRVDVATDRVVFVPRFPLVPGLSYRVAADWPRLASAGRLETTGLEPLAVTLTMPPSNAPRAEVAALYPSTEEVPANLLRLYVHFSQPMSRGEAYRHIRLLREDGSEVSDPFLEIDEELWDGDQRRLTLFFDPGRIKRGLRPNAEAGPPLGRGDRLRLVIDGRWLDGHGRPLLRGHEKDLVVVEDDRRSPRLDGWDVAVPAAGSRHALTIRFAEPLDYALALRMIRIEETSGRRLAGTAALDQDERRWRFVPSDPWEVGTYRISVDGALEDRSGNSLRGTFDRDLERGETENRRDRFSRPFVVGAPASR